MANIKKKYEQMLNESNFSQIDVTFKCDCVPTIDNKTYMSGAVILVDYSVLIITKHGISEHPISEIDDINVDNKFFEKNITLHNWKQNINVKINFINDLNRQKFFDLFKYTFTEYKVVNNLTPEDIENKEMESDTKSNLPYEELKQLKELLDMGALTQEEFDIKKKELLNL